MISDSFSDYAHLTVRRLSLLCNTDPAAGIMECNHSACRLFVQGWSADHTCQQLNAVFADVLN